MMQEPEKIAELTTKLFLLMLKVNKKNKRFKLNASSPMELSREQFHILGMVEMMKLRSVSELSYFTHKSSSSCSLAVSKLEQNGYVVKQYNLKDGDKRKMKIFLTDKGRHELNKITELIISDHKAEFEAMSPELQLSYLKAHKFLRNLLGKSFVNIEESDDDEGLPRYVAEEMLMLTTSIANRIVKQMDYNTVNNRLHPGQLALMFVLKNHEENTVSQLADKFDLSESAISLMLSRLAESCYVKRQRPSSGQDGRRVYFIITEGGERALEECVNYIKQHIKLYYESLSKENQEFFYQGVNELYSAYKIMHV